MINPHTLLEARPEPSYSPVAITTLVFGMLCFWIGLACYLLSGIW
jgi:hypothetical protein